MKRIRKNQRKLNLNIFKHYKSLIISFIFALSIFLPENLAVLKFILITFGLIFASEALGFATEELSTYFSSTLSGFLNATFGNLAELIIGLFVILKGQALLAQASLTGSILGNLVLLVGLAFFVASYRRKSIKLNAKETDTASTMLLTSVLFLLFPSLLFLFHEQQYTIPITLGVAVLLLSIYIFYLIFSFFTHKDWFIKKDESRKPTLSKTQALILMILSIIILTILSERVSQIIEHVAHVLNLNDLFLGAIVLGFVGNAAENLSVIGLASKGKHEFVLPIAIGSSLQIAMFVTPILVIISYFAGHFMSLSFLPLEIFSIFVAVLLANQISQDKEVTWFESIQLVMLYLVIALVFYFA